MRLCPKKCECLQLLEGKRVNLRVMVKEDLPLVWEWANNPDFGGEYASFEQISLKEAEK